jgi:AcrR family transcriptional regulator
MVKDQLNSKKCSFFGKKAPPTETTKEQILEAARKHFCENGFVGASVRDICDEANANVSAIKYHFGGKEGLYRECFKIYGQSRLNSAAQILTKANSSEELKLRRSRQYAHDQNDLPRNRN